MLWRKLNRVFYRKGSVLTVMLVVFWGIAGMFLQYQLYCMEASHLKWRPLEKMGEDWYYYISDAPTGKTDVKKQAVQEMGSALGMWQLRALGTEEMDMFQYSGEAWEWFDYPIAEGEGFSSRPDEIIVSPGLAKEYPVGSEIKITCYPRRQSKFVKEDTEFTCTVVGVLGQGEIFYRFSGSESNPQYQESEKAMFCGSQTQKTLFRRSLRFGVVNPLLNVSDNCRDESAGVFFRASQKTVSEIDVTYQGSGEIKAVSQMIDDFDKFGPGVDIYRVSVIVLIWLAVIVYAVVWQGVLLRQSVEELGYLMYIKYNKMLIWRRFLRVPASRFAIAWLVSCMAYFLPNDFYWFWQMHWYVPFVTLPLYMAAGCLGRCFANMYLKDRYLTQTQKYLGETELLNYLYIKDLSVTDNLILILLAQNYSEREAARMVKGFLIERDIYYRGRRMDRLDIQKKFEFYQLRDELLGQ